MLARIRSRLTYANVGVTLVLALAVGGIAIAGVPGRDGKITGCYEKRGGDLRVIDASKRKCKAGERKLVWNQKGPQGAPGPAGAPGSAVAYAYVTDIGIIRLDLSKNVNGVTRPFAGPNPGFYCIDTAVPVKSFSATIEIGASADAAIQGSVRPDRVELADPLTCPPPFNDAVVIVKVGTVSTAANYFIVFN
jgi:hypothetical protein